MSDVFAAQLFLLSSALLGLLLAGLQLLLR